jgi:hypothetical protein
LAKAVEHEGGRFDRVHALLQEARAVFAYPTEAEAKSPELRRIRLLEPLRAVIGRDVKVIDVASDPRWSGVHYRDPIHPDAAATKVLAAIISNNLH